jgi:hypothetical protein
MRQWAIRYAGCRFRFASEPEHPSLKARLLDIAQYFRRERNDIEARRTLQDMIEAADSLAAPGSDRRSRLFINLARAAIDLGERDLARTLISKAEPEISKARSPEDDTKLLEAVQAELR